VTGTAPLTTRTTPPTRLRLRRRRRWPRRVARALVVLLLAVLLPVPWLHHVGDDPVGFAWRLSGRLHVDGQTVDPPGRWTWLTVGRPPLLGEVAWGHLQGEPPGRDLRTGPADRRPRLSDPSAAAVGLNAAGAELPLTLLVEVSGATHPGLPDPAVLTHLNGIPLRDRDSYRRAVDRPRQVTWFRTEDGARHRVEGTDLPYLRIRVSDVAPAGLDARIGGDHAALRWLRDLSVGSSHGVIVALTVYADASGDDLARGRHIAGTGRIGGDGSVGPIGGLAAKAAAARRAGADVLIFPGSQAGELADFDPGAMQLVGVGTLAEAIAALRVEDPGT
jgi:hypothetical protein